MLKQQAVELLEDIYATLAEADEDELSPDLLELRDRLSEELGYEVKDEEAIINDPDESDPEEEEEE